MGVGDAWLGRSLKEGTGRHFESTDMPQMFPEVTQAEWGTEVEEAFFSLSGWLILASLNHVLYLQGVCVADSSFFEHTMDVGQ